MGLRTFGPCHIGLATLTADVCLFVYSKNCIECKSFSPKSFASGVQQYIKETQLWFFIGVVTWLVFFTLKVYSYTLVPAIFTICIYSAFYGIFYVCEIKKIPLLSVLARGAFVSTWFCFAFANSFWNSFYMTVGLFLFFAFQENPTKKKVDAFVEKLAIPQEILRAHYTVEAFCFKILKDLTLGSLIVVYKIEFLFKPDLTTTLGMYYSFFFETVLVLKFLIYVSLLICSLLDLFMLTSFNAPTLPTGEVANIATAGVAITSIAVAVVSVINHAVEADHAVTAKATSMTENPGHEERYAKKGCEVQGWSSPTADGNKVGTAVKSITGQQPYTHDDKYKSIDLSKNVDLLQNKLATKSEAAIAEKITGLKCTSLEEQAPPTEEEINKVIKHLIENPKGEKELPSVVAAKVIDQYNNRRL